MSIQSTIQAFAVQGMPDRAIVARMGLSLPHVRSARCRGALPPNAPHRPGRPRTLAGDAMALAFARCGSYSAVARVFAVAPSTVFEAVQRRVR